MDLWEDNEDDHLGRPLRPMIPVGHEVLTQEIRLTRVPNNRTMRRVVYDATTRDPAAEGEPNRAYVWFPIDELPRPPVNDLSAGIAVRDAFELQLPGDHIMFEIFGRSAKLSDVIDILLGGAVRAELIDSYIPLLVDRARHLVVAERVGRDDVHVRQRIIGNFKYMSYKNHEMFPNRLDMANSTILGVHFLDGVRHPFLAVYKFRIKRVRVYDVCWTTGSDFARDELVRNAIRNIDETGFRLWNIQRQRWCSQTHASFGGTLVIRFALNIICNAGHENFKNMKDFDDFLLKLAADILYMSAEGRQILAFLVKQNE